MIFKLIGLLVLLIFGLGWIALLAWGIVRMRRDKVLGTVVTVLASIWGFVAISVVGVGIYGYRQISKYTNIPPFEPSSYHGKMGKIEIDYKGNATVRAFDDKTAKGWLFQLKNGVAKAPVGKYDIMTVDLSGPGGKDIWSVRESGDSIVILSGTPKGTKASQIDVSSDKPVRLSAGLPLHAKVSISDEGENKVSLDLEILNSHNQQVSVSNNEMPRFAGFQVLSKSGNVLWHGTFEPG